MKRTLLLLNAATVLLLTATSCDWLDNLLSFDFTTSSTDVSFTVDPASSGEHVLTVKVIQSDLEQEIEDNGGDISNLKSVEMDEAKGFVISAGKNFDDFESLTVTASTASTSDMQLAWVDNIPDGATEIDLSVSTDDLKSLLDEDEYTITVTGVLSNDLTESIDLKVSLKYHVTVGP